MENTVNKYIGREFMNKMVSVSSHAEAYKAALKELRSVSLESRVELALSLIAIGSDGSEPFDERGFALGFISEVVHFGGLRNNQELEDRLINLVNRLERDPPEEHFQTIPTKDPNNVNSQFVLCSAMLALIAVNRMSGLQYLDQLINRCNEFQCDHPLRKMRRHFTAGVK